MDARRQLLDWIEADRDKLVGFFSDFLSKPSPNPPGDTREAASFVAGYLRAEGIDCQVIAPMEHMPNILTVTEGSGPGRPWCSTVTSTSSPPARANNGRMILGPATSPRAPSGDAGRRT